MRGTYRSLLIGAALVISAFVTASGSNARPVKTGTVAGHVTVALRPSAGSVTVARAIDAENGTIAASRRIGASGSFQFAVTPGVYLVIVEKVSLHAPPVTGFGRLARAHAGRRSVIPTIKPGSAAKRTLSATEGVELESATGRVDVAANGPAVAVKEMTVSGPYAIVAKGLDDLLYTYLFGSSCYVLVEWEKRALILNEIRFQRSRYGDPSTRITPRLIAPTVFVEGSVATTEAGSRWSIRARDVASGQIIASDSGSAAWTPYVEAWASIGRRLRAQVEKELCGRFMGSFSGRTREGAGGQTLDYSFAGTVTFTRSSNNSRLGYTSYRIARITYRTTFTLGGACTGTASATVSLGPDDQPSNELHVAKSVTPGKGRRYEINFTVQSPARSPLRATCSGTAVDYPWSAVAQVITPPAQLYADASATRLRGTRTVPGTPISYTWNLRGAS